MELLDRVRKISQATLDGLSPSRADYEWQVAYTLYADENGTFPIILFWLSKEGHSTWQWVPVEEAHDNRVHDAVEAMWVRVTSNALLWNAEISDSYADFDSAT